MERLQLKYESAIKALKTLEDVLNEPYSEIVRDAAIQRFEYTFEAFWKYIREYLKEREGVVANSPKSCFKECFSTGLIDEDETVAFLEMTDKRNETTHTYNEELANKIFSYLPDYSSRMKAVLGNCSAIKDKII